MGLNPRHLLQYVIRPVLTRLDMGGPVAEALVLGTAITESRLEYLHQVGGGPAVGLWQMEPATFGDINTNWLKYNKEVDRVINNLSLSADATEMAGNLYLGAAMCRIHYRRVSEPLPLLIADQLAAYWKLHYNTPRGAGTIEKATPHFEEAIKVVNE